MSVKQGGQRTTTRLVAATTESGQVVSVPVSLPVGVGSLLGTAFNVITPDQLPQNVFKQMLCVDSNGFISGNAVVSDVADLKPTHIVIQQQAPPNETTTTITTVPTSKILITVYKHLSFQKNHLHFCFLVV